MPLLTTFLLKRGKKYPSPNCIILMQLYKGFVYALKFRWEWLWQSLFLKPFTSKLKCLKRKYSYGREGWSVILKDQQKAIWSIYSKTRLKQ